MTTRRSAASISPPSLGRRDALGVLSLYLLLLYAVPSTLRVVGLGSAGSPAMLLAIVFLVWWAADHLRSRTSVLRAWEALPGLLLVFALSLAAAYVSGMLRGHMPIEGSTADMGLLRLLAWTGVFLVAYDGIRSEDRLVRVVRRLVLAGALLSVLGLLQFALGRSLIEWVSIPGLVSDGSSALIDRSGFTRPVATALHPLEFGVVITMSLPFAAVLAVHDRGRPWLWRFGPVVAVIAAISVSLSRSAILGLAAVVLVMALGWRLRTQVIAAGLGLVVATGVYLVVPGMGRAVVELFGGIGTDDSTASRIGALGVAGWVSGHRPLLGTGLGTFVPQYYILDNQWLLLVVETGVIGAFAFLSLLCGGVWCAWHGRRLAADPFLRDLGQAFAAAIIGCALIMAFFDGLSFPMAAGTLFLVLGLTGSYARMSERAGRASSS